LGSGESIDAQCKYSAQAAAPGFVAHLLAVPKDDGAFDRLSVAPREVDFS
jgi:hypothetical protein